MTAVSCETVEEFEVPSKVHKGLMVGVCIRRDLNSQSESAGCGPYFLHLRLGFSTYQSYGGLTHPEARELALRFLLKHDLGIAPPHH